MRDENNNEYGHKAEATATREMLAIGTVSVSIHIFTDISTIDY